MRLLSSPASPFGRKVKITAELKGLSGRISVEQPNATPEGAEDLKKKNPLGKIPALILDDGTTIHDSHIICEYLDAQVAQPVLFPGEGPARWQTLTLASLADGILDAALLLVYEKRYRPEEKWHQEWMDRQWSKVNGALDLLETDPPKWGANPDYGHITLACALGYLDFRHGGSWREGHPKLVDWLERFAAAVPAFGKTKPE